MDVPQQSYPNESDESNFDDSENELLKMLSMVIMMRRRRKKNKLTKKKKRKAPRFWIREIFNLRAEYG